jgi:dihydropteroate synthase
MGVVNVTPDSFSDGGRHLDATAAIEWGRALVDAGADIVDVGGESTRPGAPSVSVDEELRRVVPVVRALAADARAYVSVDTTKAVVATAALEAGAAIVNDVSGGTRDPAMLQVVAEARAGFVAMHMRGTPATMQAEAHYDDVVGDVARELGDRVAAALAAGVDRAALLADPGIGFAKDAGQNFELLGGLGRIAHSVGVPLLVGASRKSFLGKILGGVPPDERDWATLATTVWCFDQGVAAVRVHAVDTARRAADLLDVMERAASTGMAA